MTILAEGDATADAVRRARLRRMRTLATSLLVLAAVVYLLTLHRGGSWGGFWGYVNAGAEASMVGAIADWFAVTALFRHPLGLPVPHTALVPNRKDDLARNLEDFFAENFLQEQVIRERLAAADVTRRLARWLTDPAHAGRVVDEAATALAVGLRRLKDEDVAALVEEVLVPRLRDEPISPIAGSLLAEIVADDAHHGFVDLVLEEAERWLTGHEDTFTEVLGERAPWWAPPRLNDAVTRRLHVEALRWVAEIRADPQHQVRAALDSMLTQLATDLLTNPETQVRAESLKVRVLEHPQVIAAGVSLWSALARALQDALADEHGPLRARATRELTELGERILADDTLRARLDGWTSDAAVWAVGRYGGEVSAVITHTIRRWDGKEASRRIELHVGRDLQFIRINGTIVGGLVGVLIHAVTRLVG